MSNLTRPNRIGAAAGAAALLVAVIVVLVIVLTSGTSHHRTSPLTPGQRLQHCPAAGCVEVTSRFFAPNSIWNDPLTSNAPLDPLSSQIVGHLLQQEATETVGVQTLQYGVPIYTVGANQPMVPVTMPTNPQLNHVMSAVPVPTNAQPAQGTDGNLVVWQPSTNTMWEFWRFSGSPGHWTAQWGGKMLDVSGSPGFYRNIVTSSGQVLQRADWGAPASSLALVGGVMTISQLESGHIDHALSLAVGQPRAHVWAWPAQRTDGSNPGAYAVPEGAHFRLPANLNLKALHLPHFVYMMAVAAQKYGIIVNNGTAGLAFRAEDPQQFIDRHGYNPFLGPADEPGTPGALFDGWPPQMIRLFPWSHLVLLRMSLRNTPTRDQVVVRSASALSQ